MEVDPDVLSFHWGLLLFARNWFVWKPESRSRDSTPSGERRPRSFIPSLRWDQIDDDGFERLLFDLLSAFDEHHNVKWLMKTRAPDRGRDLSLERILRTPTGESRVERVLVQAKHWLSKSIGDSDVSDLVVKAETWTPPFHTVVMVTSGRFTSDAVTWSEIRASSGRRPDVELWSEADLERLLSRFPSIAAAHGLR